MKRIVSLVLCLVFALTAFASCKDHTHTFASDWSADAENHWHQANCEHDSEKSDVAAHTGTEDGICDVCGFVTAYTVTVNPPEGVTIEGTLSGAPGTDVTFKASVDSAYSLSVTGAEIVGEPEAKDAKLVYTLKVAAIKANTTVNITAIKTVYGAEISNGEGSIEAEQAWVTYYSEVTVSVPAAGKYAIFASDDSGVQFGENTEENLWSFDQVYKFDATEAGEIKIKASVWPQNAPEDGVIPFEYTVVSYEDVVLIGTKGTYTLPAGVVMDVTFKAPVAGLYQITSEAENLAWNDSLDSSVTVGASEDGAEITFTLQCQDLSESTFEFDFEIISFSTNAVNEGENEFTFTYGEYFTAEFTAPKAGAYSIVANSEDVYFYEWSDEYNYMAGIWGDYITKNLEEGEKLCFYIKASNFEATAETLDAVITITHAGYLVESENNTYTAKASEDGVLNVWNGAWIDGFFIIKAPEGFSVSVDNGATWAKEVTVTATSGSISFLLKGGADTADVVIEEFENKLELTVGTNTVTMTAGTAYNVYVDGFTTNAMYKSFIISWNNPSVIASGWSAIVSGDQIDFYMSGAVAVVVSLDGANDAEVTFTITDVTPEDDGNGGMGGGATSPDAVELTLGDNSILVTDVWNGVICSFTASEAGTYTFSAAAGETNGNLMHIEGYYGGDMPYGEWYDFPYEIELAADESVELIISVLDVSAADTVDFVIAKA